MKLRKLINLSLAVGLLAPAHAMLLATGAGANPLDVFTPAPVNTQAQGKTQESTPEIDAAGQRVESAKTKLDQAKKQLSAAKAMLKACEAEYKAARADKEALALRTEARKLADASGLKDNGAEPIQPDASIKSFVQANPASATTPKSQELATTPDLSGTRIQTSPTPGSSATPDQMTAQPASATGVSDLAPAAPAQTAPEVPANVP